MSTVAKATNLQERLFILILPVVLGFLFLLFVPRGRLGNMRAALFWQKIYFMISYSAPSWAIHFFIISNFLLHTFSFVVVVEFFTSQLIYFLSILTEEVGERERQEKNKKKEISLDWVSFESTGMKLISFFFFPSKNGPAHKDKPLVSNSNCWQFLFRFFFFNICWVRNDAEMKNRMKNHWKILNGNVLRFNLCLLSLLLLPLWRTCLLEDWF